MNTGYAWQELYEAAILETDLAKLQHCLSAAKAAIDARLQELQADHGVLLKSASPSAMHLCD